MDSPHNPDADIARAALTREDSYPRSPFAWETLVVVTLNAPREKFWGAVLDLGPAGLSIRGVDLNSFDDSASLVKSGELVAGSEVFFPMHRIERIEADARSGEIPSLRERFERAVGRDVSSFLCIAWRPHIEVGCTLRDAQRRLFAATIAAVDNDLARAARILDIMEDDLRSWLYR